MSNSEIADRLASLAQLLSTQKENPYKVKSYRRAAASIRTMSESIDELVREEAASPQSPTLRSGPSSLPGMESTAVYTIYLTRPLGR